MRFARGDLRTHIDSYKNDHRPSYWLQSTLPLQQCRKNDFREIFGVFRFSTFSTASVSLGSQSASGSGPFHASTADVQRPAATELRSAAKTRFIMRQNPSTLHDFGRLLALHHRLEAVQRQATKAEDVTDTLQLALTASYCDQARVVHKPRLLSDNGAATSPANWRN